MIKIEFKKLSEQEEKEFRRWARDNPQTKPCLIFHPVINDELNKIQGVK